MKYLIYCTMAKPYLAKEKWNTTDKPNKWVTTNLKKMDWAFDFVNGKIVAGFEGNVEEIIYDNVFGTYHGFGYNLYNKKGKHIGIDWHLPFCELLEKSCLNFNELDTYLNGNKGYAIHIKNLKVFDEPLTIEALYQPIDNNFCKECKEYNTCDYAKSKNKPCKKVLLYAPQNMCYCWYKGEKYCLISIRPEWVCKILNGDKTIEVRKKVLKGML